MIFDRLSKDVFNNDYFLKLYKKINKNMAYNTFNENKYYELDEKELGDILRFGDILSNSDNSKARNIAYKIVSLLSNDYKNNSIYKTYSTAILSSLGNFPAINYFKYDIELPFIRKIKNDIKEINQKVPGEKDKIFTDSQYELFTKLKKSNVYSFSGPTSMGKSFILRTLIFELLYKNEFDNFVVIVPTRALIQQFSVEIKKDLNQKLKEEKYKVVSNSSISDLPEENEINYIFILTPERLLSFLSKKDNPKISHLFVDEAHKIASRNDYRSITFYLAIEKCLKKYNDIKLYFSSPNISNPEVFLDLFDKNSEKIFKTNESPVSQNLFLIDLIENDIKHLTDFSSYSFCPTILDSFSSSLDIIFNLGKNNSNIIYCNSVNKTINKAREFRNYYYSEKIKFNKKEEKELKKTIKLVQEFVHKDYYLIECLKYGIGFHFGKLPQVIRNRIEKLFEKGILKNIFCTSTLLEGVNLPAKNIFILNDKRGNSNMTKIDFHNLAGRAGRLNHELYGNIFCIKEKSRDWNRKNIIEGDSKTEIEPSIISQTKGDLDKIESIILKKNIKTSSKKEKEILKYIANIIAVDTLDLQNYQSPIIKKLIEEDKENIIDLARKMIEKVKISKNIITTNQSIMVEQQLNAKEYIINNKDNFDEILFPKKVNHENCLTTLNKFYDLYNWQENEVKKIQSKESLKFYALLMNWWINELSLSQMINNDLNYNARNHCKIYYYEEGKRIIENFNIKDKKHVNTKINNLIKNIENVLRFTFEKYYNHYYLLLVDILDEESAGQNWGNFLEYGSRNPISISLQNIGFSRHVANYLVRKHKECLEINNNKLIDIDKDLLINSIPEDTLEYEEVNLLL